MNTPGTPWGPPPAFVAPAKKATKPATKLTLREAIALRFATAMIQGLLPGHTLKGPNIKGQRSAVLQEAAVWADEFIATMKAADGE